MKRNYFLLIVLTCLFAACQKQNNTPPPGGGGGNNGGGGNTGGSDTLSVKSFSPVSPYTSDIITITGTGFNADKTKDSVFFSTPGATYGRGYLTIVSATATQIQFAMQPDSVSGLMGSGTTGLVDIQVSANGKKIWIINAIKFKMSCILSSITGGVPPFVRPGDSIGWVGRGWSPTGNVFSINGQVFANVKVDSTAALSGEYSREWFGLSYLSKSFFGEVNNEDSSKTVPVSVTNADGKMSTIQVAIGLSPIMKVTDAYYEGQSYATGTRSISLQDINSKGGRIRLHVIGKNLKNNADVWFYGTEGTSTHSSLAVSGFQDSTIIEFGAANLKPGYYYTTVLSANNSSQGKLNYGAYTFFVTN